MYFQHLLSHLEWLHDVFDSMPSCSFHSHDLHRQLAAILQCKLKTFTILFVNVQCQAGSADCGVFALALCFCVDPHPVPINQPASRRHLLDCFNNKTLCLFPPLSKPRRKRKRILLENFFLIFWLCRQPTDSNYFSNSPMAQCSLC